MARIDTVRHRIELTAAEFEALRLVHNGEPVGADRRDALVAAGLVTSEGTIDPLVMDLVRGLSEPMIECAVETAGPQGPTLAQLAIHEETLWYTDPWPAQGTATIVNGEAPDGEAPIDSEPVTYCRDELPQLLWVLARLLGLRRHEVPKVATPFTVPLLAIDAVLQTMALGAEQWEPARTVAAAKLEELFGPEIGEVDRVMLMATLTHLEATARVTVVWGPGEQDIRGLALWSCGDGGYWVRSDPAEPLTSEQITPEALATFRPVSAAEVWRGLADLLPSSRELREVIERVGAAT